MSITINYLWPVFGSTPPTVAQAANVSIVTATIFASSAQDTAAVITHNFGMPASDISAGWPIVEREGIDSLAGANGWWTQSIDPNWVGIARLTSAQGDDTVPSIKVRVWRPHTIIR
jgi:hypothetical protein